MSDQKEYDNELKGFMWHENDSTIHRKGSITINGQKKYSAIVESTNDKGEKKHELMVSVGLLDLLFIMYGAIHLIQGIIFFDQQIM